jgi:hypothetical protein
MECGYIKVGKYRIRLKDKSEAQESANSESEESRITGDESSL